MTTTQPNPERPTMNIAETLAPLIAELTDVLAAKAELEQRERDIKATIRQTVPGPDNYAAGDATLTVTTNRRFDPKKALPLIPETVLPLVTYAETVVDKERLRVLLPDVFEAAQVEGDYRIAVK